ncbi:branched-chain amino acid ABC transporter permease [Castellaniella sp.]|uniref:branched-chain amino acid ABC transporter permease n=1 Tax=Castellaniella sp. TaxID=1955812 RepID=UPI003C730D08
MDFYYGLIQIIGIHALLGLSSYWILLTGQVSLAQAAFFGIGAYLAGMLTTLWGWPLVPALLAAAAVSGFVAFLIGFPALRVKGLMLVVATIAFSEVVRIVLFNFKFRVSVDGVELGPAGGEGFSQIRYFSLNGWSVFEVMMFIWAFVLLVLAMLWWLDRSRIGVVLRAVGEDELAAQAAGINVMAIKVLAMTVSGALAGLSGGIFAHYTTHVEHAQFGIVLAAFALSYPIIGGLSSVFGTVLAAIFIQGVLVEGLRFMGDWRSFVFGLFIILTMNFRPDGFLNGRPGWLRFGAVRKKEA